MDFQPSRVGTPKVVTIRGPIPWHPGGMLLTNQDTYHSQLPDEQALWVQCKAVHNWVRQILTRDGVPLRPGERMTITFEIGVEEAPWASR